MCHDQKSHLRKSPKEKPPEGGLPPCNDGCGSKTEVGPRDWEVCFTPDSGHQATARRAYIARGPRRGPATLSMASRVASPRPPSPKSLPVSLPERFIF
jgi:hypothetical protein